MKNLIAARRIFASIFVLLAFLGLSAPRASATHLRGGTLSWKVTSTTGSPVTGYTVQFTFSEAQRWSYPNNPGTCTPTTCSPVGTMVDLVNFTGTGNFYFGDGSTGDPTGTITSINQAEDYQTATFTFTHVYTVASGAHTAYFFATNRISTLKLGHDQPEYISTSVQYYPNGAPTAAVPAIVAVPLLPTTSFNLGTAVTDIDPNAVLSFRLATFTEIYGPSNISGITSVPCPSGTTYLQGGVASGIPPGFTISTAGFVTWNTAAIQPATNGSGNCGFGTPAAGDLWATQIMVEARNKTTNALITQTPIDLLMKFVTPTGALPTIVLNPTGPQTIQVNHPVAFTATGNSTNSGTNVTLNATGVPVGATTSGLNSSVTPPATSNFNWTPTSSQAGTYVVTYTVTDSNLQQASASETIVVASAPPTATCSGAFSTPYNQAAQASVTLLDPNSELLNVVWALDGSTVHTDSNFIAYPGPTLLTLNQTYGNAGPHTLQVTATDPHGVSAICSTPITVTKADQTINFGTLSNATYGDPDFPIGASASSGLVVSFAPSGSCTIIGNNVHITGTGLCTITASQPGDTNYNAAPKVPQSFTIGQATAAIHVTAYSVPYDGNPHTATATATGVGNVSLIADLTLTGTTHTGAGTYPTDAWSFHDPSGNYADASGTVSDAISQATATVTVTAYNVPYDANPHTATGKATGAGGADLLADLTLTGTTHTNAGTYAADSWSFHDPAGNYSDVTGVVTDTIKQATATVVVTPYNVPYDANSHTATAVATGVGGVDLIADVDLAGTIHTAPGTYANDPYKFHDASGNYTDLSGTVSDMIRQAIASITVMPYNLPYTATPHSASGSATGIAGANLNADLSLANTIHTPAGSFPGDAWTFHDPSGIYADASGMVSDQIQQAPLTVTTSGSSQYSDPLNPTFSVGPFLGLDTQANSCIGSVSLVNATPGSAPATYTAAGDLTCANYSLNSVGSYSITQEDATLTYTGLQYFGVPATQTTVNVTLSYTLQDASVVLNPPAVFYDANPGDITKAVVAPVTVTGTYLNGSNLSSNYTTSCIPTAVTAAAGLTLTGPLLGTVPSTGTFTCAIALPVNGTFTATVAAATGSYYTPAGDTQVTIATSNGPGLLTGGGYQVASYLTSNGGGTGNKYAAASAVQLLPATNTKMNYGFVAKQNKNGSTIQGNVNIVIRSQCLAAGINGTSYIPNPGPDGLCVYQVDGQNISSMSDRPATSTIPGYGVIVSDATVTDVTSAVSQTLLTGGTTQMQMYDNGTGNSSAPDTLGIQVTDGNGRLWLSNNWNPATLKTVTTTGAPQVQGGNVQAH